MSEPRTRVLSVQTTLLGNRTYGELLRRAFADSEAIAFDAHWSTEAHDREGGRPFARQLDRLFLKMVERPAIRRRNLDFFPLRFELGTSYWARRTLRALLRDGSPDVVHLHTQGLALLALDVMARVPTVVSADGTSYQMAAQQLPPSWRWTFAGNHVLEGRAFRRAAAVVTFSQWAKASIVARHRVPAERVHVVPPGIDVRGFPYGVARAARSEGPMQILFVGGEFERKGGPELVAAFLALFGEDPSVELHLVTASAHLPVHPRVVVHAGVTAYGEAWHERYRRADLFVMPTRRDQSPIVYLEAMAAGLPVIATPVGSAAEAVIDGVTGFLVPPHDAGALANRIARLVRDPALRASFGVAGRALVERSFEARTNAKALERVLVDSAGSTRTASAARLRGRRT